jgi:kynurenine formamidase
MGTPRATAVSAEEFGELVGALGTWGRWGAEDQRGALNHLTPGRITAAAGLVQDGTTVGLSLPLNTEAAGDNPKPAVHYMTEAAKPDHAPQSLHFQKDYVGADYHYDGHTHIDALCHVAYEGMLYNGRSAGDVTKAGAEVDSIEVLESGLVGRGVLLDIPRTREVRWLEPGESIFREDLEEAERRQVVSVQPGDILLVRTGHARRLAELGPWDTAAAKAGLHPTAMTFVSDRSVAVLGSDANSDAAPSDTEGVDFPIHVLAIAAMGVHLLDYLQLEDLRGACEEAGRWEFLFSASPLRLRGGTGSPINPTAVF